MDIAMRHRYTPGINDKAGKKVRRAPHRPRPEVHHAGGTTYHIGSGPQGHPELRMLPTKHFKSLSKKKTSKRKK